VIQAFFFGGSINALVDVGAAGSAVGQLWRLPFVIYVKIFKIREDLGVYL